MYCRKCGKYIEYEADVCTDCQEMDQLFANLNNPPAYPDAPAQVPQGQPAYPTEQPAYQQSAQPQYYYQQDGAYHPPVQQSAPLPNPAQNNGSVMDGFGPALTGMILGIVSLIFAGVMVGVASDGASTPFFVLFIISLGLIGTSLTLGTKSISRFKEARLLGRRKPIPALVLGIFSCVWSAFGAIYAFLGFIMALTI